MFDVVIIGGTVVDGTVEPGPGIDDLKRGEQNKFITALDDINATLSGGEAQRVKLSRELSKRDTGRTLYILDEPTTGLHFEDIKVFLKVIDTIVDKGNSVLIIEHNMDVIKVADYIIDIGKEGGQKGGQLICNGTPEKIVKCKDSYTAKYLKSELKEICYISNLN